MGRSKCLYACIVCMIGCIYKGRHLILLGNMDIECIDSNKIVLAFTVPLAIDDDDDDTIVINADS